MVPEVYDEVIRRDMGFIILEARRIGLRLIHLIPRRTKRLKRKRKMVPKCLACLLSTFHTLLSVVGCGFPDTNPSEVSGWNTALFEVTRTLTLVGY